VICSSDTQCFSIQNKIKGHTVFRQTQLLSDVFCRRPICNGNNHLTVERAILLISSQNPMCCVIQFEPQPSALAVKVPRLSHACVRRPIVCLAVKHISGSEQTPVGSPPLD
jgi:hypothetical protein